jgi:hypothetical protein
MEKYIRKIVKNGRESYYTNIPKDIMRELRWREKQKVVVTRVRGGLLIRDWKRR